MSSSARCRALVRLSGELATKSRRTRSRFQNRLVRNLRDALEAHGLDARVEHTWSRLYVTGPEEITGPLERTFGISSFSVLEGECEAELDSVVETGRRLFAERVRGRTYAVRARRSGRHPFRSMDVQRELGAALNPGAEVHLDDPEVEVRVEVRDGRAYFFSDRKSGAGGLPLGVQGRGVALISGGFDSAVAAWMALRRGIQLDYVFCNLGGAAYARLTVEVAKALADRWSYGTRPRLYEVDFAGPVEEMRRSVKPAYLQVVLKRLMYRAATRIATERGADALITGESVGQVSSQTLPNLRAIDGAAELPVLRPLLGFDKEEILERARAIGTYELSARVREYCQVAPDRPVTAASPADAAAQEARVDPRVLEGALQERKVFDLRELRLSEIAGHGLFLDEVPPDARVIDVREEGAYREWHYPGAEHKDADELARSFTELDREPTYLLCCERGLRTAHLAERMQAAGYEAYSFRGGAAALRRRTAQQEAGSL